MGKTINPIQMIKNQVHNSSYKAKSRAEDNGVYICKNKEEKEFEFVPLENVIIKGVTLEQYIKNVEDKLHIEIENEKKAINNLKELVEALTEHIDKQRFL